MARLTKWQQQVFLTPAQSRAVAQEQLDAVNRGLAQQRQLLTESICALAKEKTKATSTVFEVKLTINRAALDTMVGEAAALEIAVVMARKIIERHRALNANAKAKSK